MFGIHFVKHEIRRHEAQFLFEHLDLVTQKTRPSPESVPSS